jgi:hypothetical protein
MKYPSLKEIRFAVLDKRLYGPKFFWTSGPMLACGFALDFGIIYAINRLMLVSYVPIFFVLVLLSSLSSKNVGKEVLNIGYFRSVIFFLASVLAVAFSVLFLARLPNNYVGVSEFLLTFIVSTVALIVAIIEVTVLGQRVSLRDSIHFDEGFFKEQKEVWEKDLGDFPNSEKILNKIDDCRFVPLLFDKGSFDLVVLWSCSIMEEIIDAVTELIIQKDPTKTLNFRKENGCRLPYALQLKNLNYVDHQKMDRESEKLSTFDLWKKVRDPIGHHELKPSFDQTFGALAIFVSFVKEFPKTLQAWE